MGIIYSVACMLCICYGVYFVAKRTLHNEPQEDHSFVSYKWIKTIAFVVVLRVLFLVSAFLISQLFFDNTSMWSIFEHWDALHYITIANVGYAGYTNNGNFLMLVFMPLYSWICRIFLLFFNNAQAVGVIVSNLFFIAGATLYHATVYQKYNIEVADTMLLLLMLSPFSFFFGAIMTESTFFFCWAAALYFARKKWWLLACIFGALGALTRLLGVLIVVMIFIEMLQTDKPLFTGDKKQIVKSLLKYGLLIIVPIGTVIYLMINLVVAGDAFAFLYYEKLNWFQEFTPIWKSLYTVFQNAISQPDFLYTTWLPNIISFVIVITLIAIFARTYALSELWYVLVYAVMTYSTSWLLSGARYMLACFPAFTMAALLLQRYKKAKALVLVGSGFLQMVYFIGYLQGKAIM